MSAVGVLSPAAVRGLLNVAAARPGPADDPTRLRRHAFAKLAVAVRVDLVGRKLVVLNAAGDVTLSDVGQLVVQAARATRRLGRRW